MRTRRAGAVAGLIWLLLAGCTSEGAATHSPSPRLPGTSTPTASSASPSGVPLAALPPNVLAKCRKVEQLRPACPTEAPEAQPPTFFAVTFYSGAYWTFSAQVGIEGPTASAPPAFVHVVAQAGNLRNVFQTFTYSRSSIVKPYDGILNSPLRERLELLGSSGKTPQGLYLGRVTWGRKTGELVLVPSFEFSDSIHAGHLLFTWSAGKVDYTMSLHAWEPFLQTVSALRDMVTALPDR